MFTHWRVQTSNIFFFLSPSVGRYSPLFLSHRFTFTSFIFLKCHCQKIAYMFLILSIYILENDIERLKRRIESLARSNDEKVINIYNYQTVYLTYHL
jgi:hypothetical protein